MKTSPKALAAHRRVQKNLRSSVWLHVTLIVLCSVLFAVAWSREWHWFIRLIFGLGIGSALIGLLADINALSDRKKTIAAIESAEEKSA